MAHLKVWKKPAWCVPAGVSLAVHAFLISLGSLVAVGAADIGPAPAFSTLAEQELDVAAIEESDEVTPAFLSGCPIEPIWKLETLSLPTTPQEPVSPWARKARWRLEDLGLPTSVNQSGPVVDGLALCLTANTDTVRPGDRITFTTWICNLTDQDLTVEVGYSITGDYLAGGTAFGGVIVGSGPMGRHYFNGMCGTGAHHLFQTIPARSAVRRDCEWTFGLEPSLIPPHGKPVMGYHCGPFLTLEAPADGVHRLSVGLASTLRKNPSALTPHEIVKASNQAPLVLWEGSVGSNEVRIQAKP